MTLRILLTQHELDPLIGERTRQRWQADGRLARSFPVDAFGRRLRIFPEFALAQVVARNVGRRQGPMSNAIEVVSRATERLYDAGPFRALTEVVHRHLSELPVVNAATLTELLLTTAPDDLRALQREMESIELVLREHAIVLDARLGRISSLHGDAVVVELAGGSELLEVSRHRMAGDLGVGAWVVRSRVAVGPVTDQFLLPSVGPERVAGLDWKQAAAEQLQTQLAATRRDDGSLEPDYAFLLWEDSDPEALDRFEQQAEHALRSARNARQWHDFLDHKRAAYADLPAFSVPPAVDASSGPVEHIDGFLSGGDWRSVTRGTRNPFATGRGR